MKVADVGGGAALGLGGLVKFELKRTRLDSVCLAEMLGFD